MRLLLHILKSHQNQPSDMKNAGKIGSQGEELVNIFPEFFIGTLHVVNGLLYKSFSDTLYQSRYN